MSLFVNHVGINLTVKKLQLVEIDFNEGRFLIENIDEKPFFSVFDFSAPEKDFTNILQESFEKITAKSSLKSDIVSFTLPDSLFYSAEIPIDKNLTSEDINNFIKWEFTKLFPFENAEDFVFDKFETGSGSENSRTIIFFALKKIIIKKLHKFCSRNNLVLKYVDNAHIASNRIAQTLIKNSGEFLSIYLNNQTISLILSRNNIPVIYRKISIDSSEDLIHLAKNLVEKLSSKIKLPYNTPEIVLFTSEDDFNLIGDLEVALDKKVISINPFINFEISPKLKNDPLLTGQPVLFSSPTAIAMRII